jgi:ATP-dependent RNA helicase DDX55/SPB4
MGFEHPTTVQRMTIPHFMSSKDVAVEAVTGSGKTLAFVIPVVEAVISRCKPWRAGQTAAVIITPTRELATQISVVFHSFLPADLQVRLLIGGTNVDHNVSAINQKGSVVVVATPGRLLVLLSRSDCHLATHVQSLEFLVLDEADRLLEMGFHQTLTSIIKYLPKQRKTGLFSATLNSDVKQLVKAGLREPVTVTVREPGQANGTTAMPANLHNYYLECGAEMRLSVLVALLSSLQGQKLLVFFATCASVSYFSSLVSRLCPELVILSLHGRMHNKRQSIFDHFSTMDSGVLMCTDVMARGVDFPAVDWVLQFDPPSSSKSVICRHASYTLGSCTMYSSFVHRCGRTARMGQEGRALILLTPSEASYVEFLRLNKGLMLQPYPTLHAPCVRDQARDTIAQERELHQLGLKAFVSFVHFYYKHECKLIFQARALDLLAHARGFALLHLPKMPELKAVDTVTFDIHPVAAHDIQDKKSQMEGSHRRPAAIKCAPRKKKNFKQRSMKSKKRKCPPQALSETDLKELASDARLLKKFKNGRISEEELDRQLVIVEQGAGPSGRL